MLKVSIMTVKIFVYKFPESNPWIFPSFYEQVAFPPLRILLILLCFFHNYRNRSLLAKTSARLHLSYCFVTYPNISLFSMGSFDSLGKFSLFTDSCISWLHAECQVTNSIKLFRVVLSAEIWQSFLHPWLPFFMAILDVAFWSLILLNIVRKP